MPTLEETIKELNAETASKPSYASNGSGSAKSFDFSHVETLDDLARGLGYIEKNIAAAIVTQESDPRMAMRRLHQAMDDIRSLSGAVTMQSAKLSRVERLLTTMGMSLQSLSTSVNAIISHG